jgi:hypothetical protein
MQIGLSRASSEPNKTLPIGGCAVPDPSCISEFLEVSLYSVAQAPPGRANPVTTGVIIQDTMKP